MGVGVPPWCVPETREAGLANRPVDVDVVTVVKPAWRMSTRGEGEE
jgi:hypothetical protein